MSANKKPTTAQTVITLILPDTDAIPRQGNILAKYESGAGKQSLAHLMPFTYSSLADIARAVAAVQQQLEDLKANPPQITVPTPISASSATSSPNAAKSKPHKPKKKKPSLDDFPMDDEDETRSHPAENDAAATDTVLVETLPPEPAQLTPQPSQVKQPTQQAAQTMGLKLKVGDSVTLLAGAVDVDGDAVDFTQGRICEIDTGSQPPRIWVESADGEDDVWVHENAFVQPSTHSDDLSAFEKPLGMGVPNNEGQLTLFG